MILTKCFAAGLVAAPVLGQTPSLELSSSPDSPIVIQVRGAEPQQFLLMRAALDSSGPQSTVFSSALASRSASQLLAADGSGELRHSLNLTTAALAGGALTVQAHTLTGSGVSWTGTGVILGEFAPRLRPLLEDQGVQRLPAAASLLGGASAAAGDLDSSGTADLVLGTSAGLMAWVQGPTGAFVDRTATHLVQPGHATGALLLPDIDGDGDADLLVASAQPGAGFPDRLWLNQGGLMGSPIGLPFASSVPTSAFLVGDVDGNGLQDILTLRGDSDHATVGARDSLWLQGPAGSFSSQVAFESAAWNEDSTVTTGGVLADFDGDGDLDLFLTKSDPAAVTGSPGAKNVLLANQGGAFQDISDLRLQPRAKDNSYSASAADVDGDGDLDLVVANSLTGVSGPQSSDVLINQGGIQGGTLGLFLDAPGVLPEAPPIYEAIRLAVRTADFNLDGRVDVFLGVHDLPPGIGGHPLFLGDGAPGAFARMGDFEPGSFIVGACVLLDVDADLDLDLFVTAGGSAGGGIDPLRARLFVNQTR